MLIFARHTYTDIFYIRIYVYVQIEEQMSLQM